MENPAFGWLIGRIMVAVTMENTEKTDETIRAALLDAIGKAEHFSLKVEWNPKDFFGDQYEDAEAVELADVICISGTVDRAQATTAGEYVQKVWPDLGSAVLAGFSAAAKNTSGRQHGTLSAHMRPEVVDLGHNETCVTPDSLTDLTVQ